MELALILLVLAGLLILVIRKIFILINSHIDWYEELTKPSHEIDWDVLLLKAVNWRTCAVAVYYKGEKGYKNIPIDDQVAKLGVQFHRHIHFKNANKAIKVLDQIVNYKIKRHSF